MAGDLAHGVAWGPGEPPGELAWRPHHRRRGRSYSGSARWTAMASNRCGSSGRKRTTICRRPCPTSDVSTHKRETAPAPLPAKQAKSKCHLGIRAFPIMPVTGNDNGTREGAVCRACLAASDLTPRAVAARCCRRQCARSRRREGWPPRASLWRRCGAGRSWRRLSSSPGD